MKRALTNLKRIVAVLVIVCLMFSLIPANTFAVTASDISGHWAQVTIQSWMDKGLIKGYPDGTFKPDQNLTRAEFMTLANRAFGFTAKATINYTDVQADAWYTNAIPIAKAAGYISGYPDNTMKPENPITREEVATIVARIKNLTSDANAADKHTDAAKISSWSKGQVGAVTSAKIMQGYPDGSFMPQGLMTRAEVVVASDNALHYTAPVATIAVRAITVTPTTMALTAGGATGAITATVGPSNATNKIVMWSSSNAAVATVAGGVVTPIGAGTATITVTTADGGKTATCTVTVTAPVVSGAPAPLTVVTPITSADVAVTKGSIDFTFSFFAGSTTPITFAEAQADLYCLDPPSSTVQLRFGSYDSLPVSLSGLQITDAGTLSYADFGSMATAFGWNFQNIPTDFRLSLSCGNDPTVSNPWTRDTDWIPFSSEEENVFALYDDAYSLLISGDALASITNNLTLDSTGTGGSTITWASSNSDVIATDGRVHRPVFGTGDTTVTLTATITKGGLTETKVFTLTVLAETTPTYTLTYTPSANGSITAPATSPTTHDSGDIVTITAVADTTYHFVNWTGDVGTVANANAASTTITMNGNYAVSASFAINTFALTYTAGTNGSIVGTSPQTGVNYGASGAQVTATPSTGYHFVSWSDGIFTAARTDTNVTGDITVSASFAINTFALTYTAGTNGSIVGTSPQTGVNYNTSGSAVTAVPNLHYHFVEWSDHVATAARTDVNVTANISVTATFAIDTVTVTFNKNGGDTDANPTFKTTNYNATVTFPTAPTKTGYSFGSWNTVAGGTGTMFGGTVTADVTVYAQWTINKYTATFKDLGGTVLGASTVDFNTAATAPSTPTRTGYTFAGWDVSFTNVVANMTVTATYTINQYTVTFDKNGGTTEASPTTRTTNYDTTVTLPTPPTRTGYTLASWNTAAGGGGTPFDGMTHVTANVTVYAQWVAITNVKSGFFTTSADNNTVTITLTGGTFKTGVIAAGDFTFAGSDAVALGATGTTFTRTSNIVVTITNLTGLSTYGVWDTVTVLAATQATQASSVVAVASTVAPVTVTASSNGIATATGSTTITLGQAITGLAAGDIVVNKGGVALVKDTDYTLSATLTGTTFDITFLAAAALDNASAVTVVMTKAGYVIHGGAAIAVANTIPVVFAAKTNSSTANTEAALGLVGTSVGSSAGAVATTDLTTAAGFVTITSVGAGTAMITVNDGTLDGTHTATIAVTVAADGSITIGAITPYVAPAAPTFVSAATSGATTIVITMSSALTGTAGAGAAFTVAGAASKPGVTGVAVSGTSVTLTLSAAIRSGETITVAYTHTGTTDLTNGTLVANFAAQSVTNNVAATPAAFSDLTANGTSGTVSTTELTLTFDVDPATLAAGDITVTGATKGALAGTGTTRTLAISAITVLDGAVVTVAIANPAGFAITPASKTVAVNVAAAPVLAVGTAAATQTQYTITYALTTGTFDATKGIVIANWALGGTNVADITPIVTNGVVLSVNNTVATITVTGAVGAYTQNYTIAPAQDAFSTGFTAPAAVTVTHFTVGQTWGGGKVAYIFQSGDPGYSATVQHGLIAATVDQGSGINWGISTYQTTSVPGGTSTAIGTGAANTDKIITQNGGVANTYAAGVARGYNGGGYNDWYLPSKDELNKLYLSKSAWASGFASAGYWSSSESSNHDAWNQNFVDGVQNNYNKYGDTGCVRAVRTF